MRALPAAVTFMDQARAWKNDTDLGNRLTDPAFGPLGRDAVLTVIGLQNAEKRPDCGTPAREQVIDLEGAGDAGIGTVTLVRDHEYVCEDRGARRVGEDRAAAIKAAAAASQISADCNPEVYDEGFSSRAGAWTGQLGLTRPVGIVQASVVPGAG